MRRFKRIYDAVEPVEEYCHGGYQPVHLDDVFNQRYKVVGKRAFGQFSTVWLAQDQLLILKAEASKHNNELATYLRLSASHIGHPGRRHVLDLLDYFQHNGPNERTCALTHTASYVRAMSKQLSQGLDFLHTLGIIHCDLQPANIMISTVNDESNKLPLDTPEFSPVEWLDETAVDDSAPKYLVPTQELLVKIGDLGGTSQQCNHKLVTPTALRAPELIHQQTWDSSIDIWALGCLINEEHLGLINHLLGDDDSVNKTFMQDLTDRLPAHFGSANIESFASFLRFMLQQDPQKRLSALGLLSHAFLGGRTWS
ncbi:kinase-like domain-containing protein [Aspergillus keveii]|uniref:non-specific serine/threonine protein kinase n=1 Tax=Aspergillus keveii TaxID=714993 RepID=A0ABR4FSS1_9EURO